MKADLTPSAQRVQNALSSRGLDVNVVELPASTRTAVEAAAAVGCAVEQIVKSLLFRGETTGKPILVLASGPTRVNEASVAAHAGEPLGKANADFVRETTGFAIGGVSPLGHTQKIETYIDEDLLKYEELWAAAGTPNAVFCFPAEKLTSLCDGKVISIK